MCVDELVLTEGSDERLGARASVRAPRWLSGAAVCAVVASCAPLQPLGEGVCGNGVTEAGEDCDLTVPEGHGTGLICGAPEDRSRACRISCLQGNPCPAGWGCAADGACVHSSGVLPSALESDLALDTFRVDDVDGDGRLDLAGLGRNSLEVRYGDGSGQFSSSGARSPFVERNQRGVALRDVTGDGRLDVAVATEEGIVLFSGDRDREVGYRPWLVASAAYAPDASIEKDSWPLIVDLPRDFLDATASPSACQGLVLLHVEEQNRDLWARVTSVPVEPNRANRAPLPRALPVAKDLCDGPKCAGLRAAVIPAASAASSRGGAVLLAPPGADHGLLVWTRYDPQRAERLGREVDGLVPASVEIPLPRDLIIVEGARPLATDADGDGAWHLHLAAQGSRAGTWAMVRTTLAPDGTLSPAVVDERFTGDGSCGAIPIAAGDLNDDGRTDYVMPDAICLSTAAGLQQDWLLLEGLWTAAEVADLDGDGLMDVAAINTVLSRIDVLRSGRDGGYLHDYPPIKVCNGDPSAGKCGSPFLRVAQLDGAGGKDLIVAMDRDGAGKDIQVAYRDDRGWESVLLGRLSGLAHAETGSVCDNLGRPDNAEDLVLARRFEGELNYYALYGSAVRAMYSPFVLAPGAVPQQPISAVLGSSEAEPWLVAFARADDTATDVYSTTKAFSEGSTATYDVKRHGRRFFCDHPPSDRFVWAVGSVGGGTEAVWGVENPKACGEQSGTLWLVTIRPGPGGVNPKPVISEQDLMLLGRERDLMLLGDVSEVREILVHDLDADGIGELVVATAEGALVLWGDQDEEGEWLPSGDPLRLGNQPDARSLALAHADADPAQELVVLAEDQLTFWSFESRQPFEPERFELETQAAATVRVGDIDLDGVQDFAVSDGERVRIFLGKPHRPLSASP